MGGVGVRGGRETTTHVSFSVPSHCVVSSPNGVDQPVYSFSKFKPADFDSPDMELAGVSLYYTMETAFKAQLLAAGEYRAQLSRALRTIQISGIPSLQTVPVKVEEVVDEVRAEPAPIEAVAAPLTRAKMSTSLGKSGAAVFERGSGIAAWQGPQIGYEVDLVLEIPASTGDEGEEEEECAEAREKFSVVVEEERTEYRAQLSRALRTVQTGDIPIVESNSGPIEEMVDEMQAGPAPVEVVAPLVKGAVSITSRPAVGMSALEGGGKSGAAVFERGSGIVAWQGLEIGYEMDLVLEMRAKPAPVEVVAPLVKGAVSITSCPAVGMSALEGGGKSGAVVFERGSGIAAWQGLEIGYTMDPILRIPPPPSVQLQRTSSHNLQITSARGR